MMFLFGIGLIILSLAGFSAWLSVKRSKESQFGLPVATKQVKDKVDMVRVTIIYNDGTKEVFEKEDEINCTDEGLLTIRLADRCITISPFAYRKVEELHI